MALASILSLLKFSYSTWQKIPTRDKKRIKKAVKEKDVSLALRLAGKYHKLFHNPKPKNVKCSRCGLRLRNTIKLSFSDRMIRVKKHQRSKWCR